MAGCSPWRTPPVEIPASVCYPQSPGTGRQPEATLVPKLVERRVRMRTVTGSPESRWHREGGLSGNTRTRSCVRREDESWRMRIGVFLALAIAAYILAILNGISIPSG